MYTHLSKAKVGTVYKVKYSDDPNFECGDLVKISKNKRLNESVSFSEFSCQNVTKGRKLTVPGNDFVATFVSGKTQIIPGFQSVYLTEELDA